MINNLLAPTDVSVGALLIHHFVVQSISAKRVADFRRWGRLILAFVSVIVARFLGFIVFSYELKNRRAQNALRFFGESPLRLLATVVIDG